MSLGEEAPGWLARLIICQRLGTLAVKFSALEQAEGPRLHRTLHIDASEGDAVQSVGQGGVHPI